jgi:hypothetical protein
MFLCHLEPAPFSGNQADGFVSCLVVSSQGLLWSLYSDPASLGDRFRLCLAF